MVAALPNLYVSPQDLYDYLTSEGVELRLDDHRYGTGQRVRATADAALASTSVAVAPLSYPLLKGSVLDFDGGGMPVLVTVNLAATARTGDTALVTQPLTGPVLQDAEARDAGVNTVTAYRLIRACQYGTAQCKLYLSSRYDDAQLATSVEVNFWAIALAAQWLCHRGGNPAPKSVDQDAELALDQLREVRVGMLALSDVAPRSAGWPFITNVTLDVGYDYKRVRVQPSQSEATRTQYGQFIDWNDALWIEW